jgi:hypothetical protein
LLETLPSKPGASNMRPMGRVGFRGIFVRPKLDSGFKKKTVFWLAQKVAQIMGKRLIWDQLGLDAPALSIKFIREKILFFRYRPILPVFMKLLRNRGFEQIFDAYYVNFWPIVTENNTKIILTTVLPRKQLSEYYSNSSAKSH